MNLNNYTLAQLTEFKQAADLLREANGWTSAITPEMIQELVQYAKEIDRHNSGFDLLQFKHYVSACGCLGPQDGHTLCGCGLSSYLDEFKYDVAIRLKEEELV